MDISNVEVIKTYIESDVNIYAIKIGDMKYVVKSGDDFGIDHEANMLKKLHHPNIIELVEHQKGRYMILQYMDEDLRDYIDRNKIMDRILVKRYMWGILSALEYCHKNNVIHLDIKPENILINNNGDIKLADFEFAKVYTGGSIYSAIGTYGYRPPNVLLGITSLSYDVDIWAAGCVFGEMLLGMILFDVDSNNNVEQELNCIFNVLGYPNNEDLQYFRSIPKFSSFIRKYSSNSSDYDRYIKNKISKIDKTAHNLLMSLLQYNPSNRLSAQEALQHPYFYELHNLGYV